ncbi:hypothetical protein DXU93_00300 [Brumimicrobium aurantiacum]|uniref:Uncharacterized protein n=1 Tax=Brumimicrobium aurantiacum TaxID=1737063 RepID=A0A3E1F0R1_9FLAO|nr:hypothetical protein DXU93_00300 [Brumimicrobium aurantiacum]
MQIKYQVHKIIIIYELFGSGFTHDGTRSRKLSGTQIFDRGFLRIFITKKLNPNIIKVQPELESLIFASYQRLCVFFLDTQWPFRKKLIPNYFTLPPPYGVSIDFQINRIFKKTESHNKS